MGAVQLATTADEPTLVSLSDEALVELAAQGTTGAFGELYRRHRAAVYGYCREILRHREDAQDAAQATMTKALVALERNEAPRSWRPWLFSIAHNEAVDQLRRRRHHDELADAEDVHAVPVENRLEHRAELANLLVDLDSLTERQRAALLLRELRGWSDPEIGAALSMPTSAVRQAVFEARAALRDMAGGRELSCGAVRRLIVAGDRRALRGRAVRAHLRACSDCDETRSASAAGSGRGFALLLAPWSLRELLARVGTAVPVDVTAVTGSTLATKTATIAAAAAVAVGAPVSGGHGRAAAPGPVGTPPAAVSVVPAAGAHVARGEAQAAPERHRVHRVSVRRRPAAAPHGRPVPPAAALVAAPLSAGAGEQAATPAPDPTGPSPATHESHRSDVTHESPSPDATGAPRGTGAEPAVAPVPPGRSATSGPPPLTGDPAPDREPPAWAQDGSVERAEPATARPEQPAAAQDRPDQPDRSSARS